MSSCSMSPWPHRIHRGDITAALVLATLEGGLY